MSQVISSITIDNINKMDAFTGKKSALFLCAIFKNIAEMYTKIHTRYVMKHRINSDYICE